MIYVYFLNYVFYNNTNLKVMSFTNGEHGVNLLSLTNDSFLQWFIDIDFIRDDL